MIKSLHIEHYALIDRLDINLHSGFSVITGETGAGKSIILGAIGLLLGERADTKAIKAGEKRCLIEALFDLSEAGLDSFFTDNELDFDEGECIIRREITSSGRSRAFINDTPVSLAQLKEIGSQLIDIHSQHKNLLLGKEDFQLNILDVLSKDADALDRYRETYKHYRELSRQLDELTKTSRQNREEEDYLRYQVNQLADGNLQKDEQEELENEQGVLSHAEEIKQALYEARQCIFSDEGNDTLQNVKQSSAALKSIAAMFPQAEELLQRLDSCYIELKDISNELEAKSDDVEYDPQRLEQVNERLSTIYTLEKRYHVDTVGELLDIQKELEGKLSLIDNSDEHIEALRHEKEEAYKEVTDQAAVLTGMRQKAKLQLETDIVNLLSSLGMPNVKFEAELTERAEPDANGKDRVAFMFSANKNIPMQPLSQIASGGEIARVMLCLKALIAGAVNLPTIIFDEIDTGVSGSIAEKMAEIMRNMGKEGRQIISITHLPQIAALGRYHYKVYKEESLFSASTHIVELTSSQRVEEIAHMLSGSTLSEAAMNNARELLKL